MEYSYRFVYLGYRKYRRRSNGEKVYRAEVKVDGRERVLLKSFKRARDAERYGKQTVARLIELAEITLQEGVK
jgi:hypothetical protein